MKTAYSDHIAERIGVLTVSASALLLILTLFLAGCAGNLVTPTTFNQQLAVGYTTVTTIRATSTTLLKANRLTPDDDSHVQSAADVGRTGLDVARRLSGVSMVTAADKLTAVLSELGALQTYLDSRRK